MRIEDPAINVLTGNGKQMSDILLQGHAGRRAGRIHAVSACRECRKISGPSSFSQDMSVVHVYALSVFIKAVKIERWNAWTVHYRVPSHVAQHISHHAVLYIIPNQSFVVQIDFSLNCLSPIQSQPHYIVSLI